MPESLLTVEQVARMLGVSRSTVWRWISAGRLPSVKVGGARRIRSSDVSALVREVPAGRETPEREVPPTRQGPAVPEGPAVRQERAPHGVRRRYDIRSGEKIPPGVSLLDCAPPGQVTPRDRALLERLRRLHAQMRAWRGGPPTVSMVDIIRQMRDEEGDS